MPILSKHGTRNVFMTKKRQALCSDWQIERAGAKLLVYADAQLSYQWREKLQEIQPFVNTLVIFYLLLYLNYRPLDPGYQNR